MPLTWKSDYWIKKPAKNLSGGPVSVFFYNPNSIENPKMFLRYFASLEEAFEYVIENSGNLHRRYGLFGDIFIEYKNWKYYLLGSPDRNTYDNMLDKTKLHYDRNEIFIFYEPGNSAIGGTSETVFVNRQGKMLEARF